MNLADNSLRIFFKLNTVQNSLKITRKLKIYHFFRLHLSTICFSIFFSHALYADNIYSIDEDKKEDDFGTKKSVLIIQDSNTGKKYEGPDFYYGHIEKVKDFNNDGIKDALLVTHNGGSGIPEEYEVVTLINNEVITADIESDFSEKILEEKNNKIYLVDKKIDYANYYLFDGKKMVLEKRVEGLKALKQVYGPNINYYDGPKNPKIINFDLNGDKKIDRVVCNIWERWGALLCDLPLPRGKRQKSSNGCGRFGVLPTIKNGYHEFVCNFDSVVTFDGSKWRWKKKPSSGEPDF